MKSHARVVVIGGGIIGCSLLYRLTKRGWSDVVLVEKNELTAGTTWHSAGQQVLIDESAAVTKLNRLSWALYKTLEAETGQPIGQHVTGSLRLAKTPDMMARYARLAAMARSVGIDCEMVGPGKVVELFPLALPDGILGALYIPGEGYVDPSMTTQAFARGARDGGAEISRQTRVVGLKQKRGGEWEVATDKGTITAEIVVNAAGMWSPEIAAMVGRSLPLVPMERQYLVTESVPEVKKLDRELPIMRDLAVPFYVRQERDGLFFGVHEKGTPFCFVDGIPPEFGQELLPPDLDRGQDHINAGIARVPALGRVGIKTVVCGPTSRTPDMQALVGPVSGLKNFYVVAGFTSGIAQAAAIGQLMSEWIADGQPSLDLWDLDLNRFGPYATPRYVRSMLSEAHTYGTLDLTKERQAGRPAKTSPIYQRLKAQGAEFGARFGWECAIRFASAAGAAGRPRPFDQVGTECRAVREGVGVVDLTSTAKYEVSGPGAEQYLERLCANSLPQDSAVVVSPMLTAAGGIQCLVTVARLAPDRFFLTARGEAELHHFDWLHRHLPADGSVRLANLTGRYATLLLAGPRSREVLTKLTDAKLSDDAFPWRTAREISIGYAPVVALRFNAVGESGWELHHPLEYQCALYDSLMDAGQELAIANVGLKAIDSLRLEKGYPMWGTELNTETNPLEAGLEAFVSLDKGDFIGREALRKVRQQGIARKLVCLVVEGGEADCRAGDAVLGDRTVVGLVSSAGYGYAVKQSIALAYLPAKLARTGTRVEVEVVGRARPAAVVTAPLYDPENAGVGEGARPAAAGGGQ